MTPPRRPPPRGTRRAGQKGRHRRPQQQRLLESLTKLSSAMNLPCAFPKCAITDDTRADPKHDWFAGVVIARGSRNEQRPGSRDIRREGRSEGESPRFSGEKNCCECVRACDPVLGAALTCSSRATKSTPPLTARPTIAPLFSCFPWNTSR